jgi:hypothetical protein
MPTLIMKHLSADEIISMYKNGERDFSNIECKSGNFAGHRLKGIIFRGSDLEGASFSGCVLDGADFSNCNLQWINFDHASLRGADFTGADLRWAKATAPVFEKTLFIGSNLNEAYIFEANLNEANFTNSTRDRLVTKFSEVSDTDFMTAEDELRKRGMSFDIILKINSGIKRMKQRWEKFIGIGKEEINEKPSYDKKEKYAKDENNQHKSERYEMTDSIYDSKTEYRKKERRK